MNNKYDNYWEHREYKKWEWRYRQAFELIKDNSNVLEIGCGDGNLLQTLQNRKACEVSGIEVSDSGINRCKQRGIDVKKFDIEKDSFVIKEKYDYIILLEVLEHLYYPEVVLKKCIESSKSVIISYANSLFYRNRLDILLGKWPTRSPFREGEHLWHWSYKDFKNFLKNNNCIIKNELLKVNLPILHNILPKRLNNKISSFLPKNFFTYSYCFEVNNKLPS